MAVDGSIRIDTKIDQKGIDKGIKTMQSKLQGTAKKLKGAGTKMSAGLTAPVLALGGIAFAAADDIDQAYRNIRVGTGATEEKLEDLKDSFDNVFVTVPDNAETVSSALSALNTLTGETGETLEGLTTSVLDASRSLGEDGVSNASAFGRVMQQWQIPAEDGTKVLDQLFKATQDYDVGLGEISSHLTEYGSVLQNAGFNMQESADLMGRLEKGGISVSRIMPGLNMAFRNWASEGKNSREEFDKVITKMQDAETETEALALATEAFGAEGAQRLTTGVRTGAIPALDELGDSMENSQGLVDETTDATKTIGEEFAELKNNAMTQLKPLGDILLDLAKTAVPPLIEGITALAEWFSNLSPTMQKVIPIVLAILAGIGPLLIFIGMLVTAFTAIMPIIAAVGGALMFLLSPIPMLIAGIAALAIFIYGHWDQIKEYTVIVFTAIKDFFVGIWEWMKETFQTNLELFKITIKAAWDWIKETTVTVWNAIKDFFVGIWNWYKDTFKSNLEALKTAISTAWNWIKDTTSSVWNGMKDTLSGIWNGLKDGVSNAFNTIKDTISGVWDSVKSSTDAIWDGITDSVKGAVNGVIGAINGMINALNNLSIKLPKIPDWVPGLGGKGGGEISFPNIPNIPSLDVGTNFVAADGLAYLHKGEAVVPKEYNPALGNGGGVYEFNIEIPIDGETVAKKTVRFTARELESMKKQSMRGKGVRKI